MTSPQSTTIIQSKPLVVRNLSYAHLQKPLPGFVDRLVEMGWSEMQANDALNVTKNSFTDALSFLLNLERCKITKKKKMIIKSKKKTKNIEEIINRFQNDHNFDLIQIPKKKKTKIFV